MPWEITDIVKPAGANPPGMSEEILVAVKQEILAFPAEKAYTVAGDTMRLDGDITFTAPDGFVRVYATQDTVQLMLKKVGQKDSRGWNLDLSFWCPGLNAPFAELLTQDPDLVVLVKKPDCEGSEYVCLGTSCRSVSLSGDFDSALANDESGRHGWSAKVEGYVSKFYYYTGTVTLKS